MSKIKFLLIFSLFYFFPIQITSAICDEDSKVLCDPTNSGNIEGFITNIFTALAVIIGVITISMVVYSGFRMIISQGNEEAVTKAKNSLQWSLTGFVLVILAWVIISAVSQFFGAQNVPVTPGEITNPIDSPDFVTFANTILRNFLALSGTIALLFIIINGFRYITARGNEEQAAGARKGLQWSIIGLVIIILAYVIVVATARLFPN